ncbi:PGC-1-related coactivator [Triplophysa tibetana]|uniref:PGC-1-related coactivator n=1 Tax=Triplophysa tibetana TaxID=1572043 RepID=A0A5A9NDS8_9TELE|nr:PGC-1-related coactivator [Triplophysa tibetana]
MAPPHGVELKDLKCRFTGNIESNASLDAQGESGKSDFPVFELDVEKTSDGSLEPSIMSIFQEKTGEPYSRLDAENEASLLSALTEILDSVDVETLSPFDTLPDSGIFSHQMGSDDTRLFPDIKISQSPVSKSGKDLVISDRQLRPRRQTVTSQRTDGEKNLRQSKSHSARTFQIESDPMFPQDELEFLLDLVRHMHPYCLRTYVEKDIRNNDVHVSSEEEEEFVDVEGYDEQEENVAELSGKDSDLNSLSEENTSSSRDANQMPQRSALVKKSETSRTKKRVSFAVHLTLVYEIPPEELDSDLPGPSVLEGHVDELFSPACDDPETLSSKSERMCDNTSPQKPKSLSLQQYRLLRQNKQLPLDERRMDHRTKWPSLLDLPSELLPILPQMTLKTPPDEKTDARSSEGRRSSYRNAAKVKTAERRCANICVDPPNPTLVTLKATQHEPESSTAPSEVQKQPPQTHPATHNTSQPLNSHSLASKPDVCSSCDDARHPELEPVTITSGSKSQMSSPQIVRQEEGEPIQTTAGEIGIEATDLTSLLEQFETQACEGQMTSTDKCQDLWSPHNRLMELGSTAGLTPPATPPHQTCKPLPPIKGTKHESMKPSPSKTIQIIDPRPLPPSKTHSKPPLPCFTPTLSPSRACIDHDYCSTSYTDTRVPSKARLDDRTEHLSGSVLLSPDTSPCRADAFESLQFSSRSPSPQDRGMTQRRGYSDSYRHSNSSSRSSCSSCSSSSSSSSRSRSRSPARKRYRLRHSGSSSSSRSSSRSPSHSPPRKRGRHCTRSRSRSLCRSGSWSRSPDRDWNEDRRRWQRSRELNRHHRQEEAHKMCQQKAIEERRVVYVGGIRGSMLPSDLKERFSLFGKVEDSTVHIRTHGDNFGFVTYYNTDDAFAAIENGSRLRRADEHPFDICFGGRRQFCKSDYADLDSSRDTNRASSDSLDFDTLLRQAQRGNRR